MIRKLLFAVSLAGLIATGASAGAQPIHLQDSGKQSQSATKSVSGKVTSIGNTGTSFAVAVDGDSKDTMEFVLNKNTQVQGQVKVGTLVAVEYQPAAGGQNLAVTVTVRG